jgi:hypothetical protein
MERDLELAAVAMNRRKILSLLGLAAVAPALPVEAAPSPCAVPTKTLDDIFLDLLEPPLTADILLQGGAWRSMPLAVGEVEYGRAELSFTADFNGVIDRVVIRREDGAEVCRMTARDFDTPNIAHNTSVRIALWAKYAP